MAITECQVLCRVTCCQEGCPYWKIKGILMPMENGLIACRKPSEKRVVSPLISKLDFVETKLSQGMFPYLASEGICEQLAPKANAKKRKLLFDNCMQHISFLQKIRILVYCVDVL